MQVTFKSAVAVCGMALALPALATDISAGVPAANIVYISGASAQTPGIEAVIASFCNGGAAGANFTKFVDTIDGKSAFAYKCANALAASGFAAGAQFIIVKRDADGSFAGVGPLLATNTALAPAGLPAVQLNWPDLTNCDLAAKTCNMSAATNKRPPQAGFTDVENAIWQARGILSAYAPLSNAIVKFTGFGGQSFGVVVTDELYKKLQTKQIADGLLPNTCVVGDFTPGLCQPSISKNQYTSITSNSASFAAYQTDWTPILGLALGAGKSVNVCRRTQTSGTQASSEMYFLATPCTANNSPTFGALTANGVGDSNAPSYTVSEASSTGAAITCLNNHNNATGGFGPDDTYAIGVISLEKVPGADKYKFVKLDGVSPNFDPGAPAALVGKQRFNTIEGRYDFAFEFEANYRNDRLAGSAATFFGNLIATLKDPTKSNLTGLFYTSNSGTITHTAFPGQVHRGTRFGNSCQPWQLFE